MHETPPEVRTALSLLAAVRLVVNTGHRFVYPFLPAIARGLGIPLEQAGLLVSARNLAGMATPLVVSVAGRREQRRRVIVAGLALFTLGAVVTAAFGAFAGALGGFVLLGLGKPVFDVASQSYLADRTPYHRRARVLGTLELTWALSFLIGAPASGWLIARYGWEAPFWAVGILAAIAVGAVLRTLLPDHAAPTRLASTPVQLDTGTTALLVVLALTSLGAETTFIVFGAWLEADFGLTLLALGAASTVIAVAELAGSSTVLAFADRLGKRRTIALGVGVAVLGFGALPFMTSLGGGLGGMAAGLLGFELTIVAAIPLASELRPGARARFLALLVVAVGVGRTAGAATGPLLFGAFGIGGPAAASAVLNLFALVLLLALVREP